MNPPFRVAIVGCGNISKHYAKTLKTHPQIELRGAFDVETSRSAELCASFGGTAYDSLDAVLQDAGVDAIINLTIHHAHAEVIQKCLEAGKHVHTEKPLAMTYDEAAALAALAERLGLRLSSSPIVFLGEAHQTAFRFIREGNLGELKIVYAEVNWGRIETWHPNPAPFYDVGVVFDVGVYPLTVLTALLGPVRRVHAYAENLHASRLTKSGEPFTPSYPDFVLAMVEFECGARCRLTANFFVGQDMSRQKGLEFHGTKGSLLMDSWFGFNAGLEYAPYGEAYRKLDLPENAYPGVDWGRCVVELADAIKENRPHRTGAFHAAHVIEIMEAINASFRSGTAQNVQSTFDIPDPIPEGTKV